MLSTPQPPAAFHPYSHSPFLPTPPLQLLWGAKELFVCAVTASSQEISCDGNSGETSCWLGHCRGLITWATETSKPQLLGRMGWPFPTFSESRRVRNCKCTKASRVSLGQHIPEGKSYICDQQVLLQSQTSWFSGLLRFLMRLVPTGTFCLEALRGIWKVSKGSGFDSLDMTLKHSCVTLQCYMSVSTTHVYFQLLLRDWEF